MILLEQGSCNPNARRGYVPEDDQNFSHCSIEKMRRASGHIRYLLNEGYDLKQASTFVGNHFLLSERQRLAITRSIASDDHLKERRQNCWNAWTERSVILQP